MEMFDIYKLGIDELGFLKGEFAFDPFYISVMKRQGIKNTKVTKVIFESLLQTILNRLSPQYAQFIKNIIIVPSDEEDSTGVVKLTALTDLLKAIMLNPSNILDAFELYFLVGFKRVAAFNNVNRSNKNEYDTEIRILRRLYNIPENSIDSESLRERLRNIKQIINPDNNKQFWPTIQKEWTSIYLIVVCLAKQHLLYVNKEIKERPSLNRSYKIIKDELIIKNWLIEKERSNYYIEIEKLEKLWAKYKYICHIIFAFILQVENEKNFVKKFNSSSIYFINDSFLASIYDVQGILSQLYITQIKRNLFQQGEMINLNIPVEKSISKADFSCNDKEKEMIKEFCVRKREKST